MLRSAIGKNIQATPHLQKSEKDLSAQAQLKNFVSGFDDKESEGSDFDNEQVVQYKIWQREILVKNNKDKLDKYMKRDKARIKERQ